MTPDEKHNQHLWWLLQRIKDEYLATTSNDPVEVSTGNVEFLDTAKIPPIGRRNKLMFKLRELGAIKILEEPRHIIGTGTIFVIEILQPKFDKLYHLLEDSFGKDKKEKGKPSNSPINDFEWGKLSAKNLETAQKVITITLDFLEFQPINRLTLATKIPLQKYESQQLHLDDVKVVLNRINGIEVRNGIVADEELWYPPPTEEEVRQYLFLAVSSQDDLRKTKNLIDKKLARQSHAVTMSGELPTAPADPQVVGDPLRKNLPEEIARGVTNELFKGGVQSVTITDDPSAEATKPTRKRNVPIEDKFSISVKDREIWVNKYLIGKPHAIGKNFEFFEYVLSQPPHTKIERKNLPSEFGDASLKKQVRGKSFIKILVELGFKGEILKAFFPKRSKDALTYNGDKITSKDLKNAGVKIAVFLKELDLAHTKYSPE